MLRYKGQGRCLISICFGQIESHEMTDCVADDDSRIYAAYVDFQTVRVCVCVCARVECRNAAVQYAKKE